MSFEIRVSGPRRERRILYFLFLSFVQWEVDLASYHFNLFDLQVPHVYSKVSVLHRKSTLMIESWTLAWKHYFLYDFSSSCKFIALNFALPDDSIIFNSIGIIRKFINCTTSKLRYVSTRFQRIVSYY